MTHPLPRCRTWILPLTLALYLVLCLAFPALASTPDREAVKTTILSGIEARYGGKSFSADFVQASTLAALDMNELASGRAWFSHPRKMKWRYLSPERHEIITNGRELWIYRPEDNQVMRGDARPFFQNGAGGAFLSDLGKLKTHYTIALDQVTPDWAELILTPLAVPGEDTETPASELQSIRIRVLTPSHQIQQVTTRNIHGDTTRFEFSNILFQPLPDPFFSFKIPDGVSIIDMEE